MKTEFDSKLEGLLKGARPEPDADFTHRISSTLAGLPARTARTRSVPRPLIVIAIIVAALLLSVGAAYASGMLGNIFGSARSRAEERMDDFNASYDERREQMEHMSVWEAAMLDMEMDSESMQLLGELAAMTRAEEHAVDIGEERDGVTLCSFSVVVLEHSAPYDPWMLYAAFNAPQDFVYERDFSITVDGTKLEGFLDPIINVAGLEGENPAVYSFSTGKSRAFLPPISDIAVTLGEREWSFRYYWSEERLARPGEVGVIPTEPPVSGVNVLTGELTVNGISVKIREAYLTGNVLTLALEVNVPSEFMLYDYETQFIGCRIRAGGSEWDWDELESSVSWLRMRFTEDTTKRPTVTVTLPFDPSELEGGEFAVAFELFTQKLPKEERSAVFEFTLSAE